MVQAAGIDPEASRGITQLLVAGNQHLQQRIHQFIRWLKSGGGQLPPDRIQSVYSILKLRFNSWLDHVDIFADVLNQRSEHDNGVWIAGLDQLAEDALKLKGSFFEIPPLICYLDRGHGAAIRRARTRLPGGATNPVAVIRVPRERMISTGIASSLVHEAGHQGAALLELIPSVRLELRRRQQSDPGRQRAWTLLDRWISEILADFWSVATLGVSATAGLISVVSLPSYFVFRLSLDDPHPFPWIRVMIGIAIGEQLFPDPQWERLRRQWESFYRLATVAPSKRVIMEELLEVLPDFAELLIHHRPAGLRGKTLGEVFPVNRRQPERLRRLFREWRGRPSAMKKARPGLVFAVLGQARADHQLQPAKENRILSDLLKRWALHSSLRLHGVDDN